MWFITKVAWLMFIYICIGGFFVSSDYFNINKILFYTNFNIKAIIRMILLWPISLPMRIRLFFMLDEDRAFYFYNLGVENQKLLGYSNAFKFYKIVLEINPNFKEVYANRGNLYSGLDYIGGKKYIKNAILDYEKFLELDNGENKTATEIIENKLSELKRLINKNVIVNKEEK